MGWKDKHYIADYTGEPLFLLLTKRHVGGWRVEWLTWCTGAYPHFHSGVDDGS